MTRKAKKREKKESMESYFIKGLASKNKKKINLHPKLKLYRLFKEIQDASKNKCTPL